MVGASYSAGGTWLAFGPAHARAVEHSIPYPTPRGRRLRRPSAEGAPTKTSDLFVGLPGSKTWPAAIAAVSRPVAHIPALFEDGLRHRSYRPHQKCTYSIRHLQGKVKDHMLPDPEEFILWRKTMRINRLHVP